MTLLDLPTHLPNTNPDNHKQTELPDPAKVSVPSHDTLNDESDEESALAIQGTNIVLKSEEDIQQWISDRKRNWPTKENIKLKMSIQKPCKFGKNCRYGKKCKNLHDDFKVINNLKIAVPSNYENHSNASSLFKMLVQNDQLQENAKVLDFLKFLDDCKLINHDF